MRASVILAILAITLIIVILCTESQIITESSLSEPTIYRFGKTVFRFTADFLCELTRTYPNKNVVGTPMGSLYVLALLGLHSCGNILFEILRAFNIKDKCEICSLISQVNEAITGNTAGITFTLNGTFIVGSSDIEFTDCFNTDLNRLIIGRSLNVDFKEPAEAARTINDVVAEQTKNKITNIISDDMLSILDRLVPVSGFYFTGEFLYKFSDKSRTGRFYGASGTEVAQYLTQREVYRYLDSRELNSRIVEIPFINIYTSFLILPNKNANIDCIMNQIGNQKLMNSVFNNMRRTPIKLFFPSFNNVTTSINSKNIVQRNLCVDSLFDQNGAEFENITQNDKCLYIRNGIQKFVFQANPNGGPSAGVPEGVPVVKFRVNKPYIFLVAVKVQCMFLPVICGYRATVN